MTTIESLKLPPKWANPALLKWARLQVGLKEAKDVEMLAKAKKAKIPAERLIAWEGSREAPTLADLEVLSELYACPVGYFFLDSPPSVKLALDFRGLAPEKVGALSYETHLHLREFDRLTEQAASLLERLELPWEVGIGIASLEEPLALVARREQERLGFTREIRQQWGSADEAFQFWRTAVENLGVFVITLKLDPQKVRGASKWIPPYPPAILVNHSDIEAATGRTFTLLHELAHLLVKRPGLVCDFRGQEDRLERFANMFAVEMVVPSEEFENFLRSEELFKTRERWGDPLLDRIRTPFKISRDVVAILLEQMGLAPPGFYREKRAMWDKRKPFFVRGGGPKHGLTKAERRLREVGPLLAKLIAAGYERGKISKLDLADLLKMRVEQAERFVAWVRGNTGRPHTR